MKTFQPSPFCHLGRILLAFCTCGLFTPTLRSETLYNEDFSSGQESLRGWQNVWGFNSVTATSEGLKLNGDGAPLLTGVSALRDLDATSIRSQILFEGSASSGVALVANASAANLTAYQGGINPNDNRLYIGANIPGAFQLFVAEEDVEFDLKSGEEVILQLDVVGNQLDLWAWRPGEPKPANPRLTYLDETIQYGPGVPGVLFDALGSDSTATYRYIHVGNRSIPEPSANILGLLGFCGAIVIRRQQRAYP